jgi:hypothetical protein
MTKGAFRKKLNAEALSDLMLRRGFDSEALSRALHKAERYSSAVISARNIQRWRSGEVALPRVGDLNRVATFLGADISSLLQDVPNESDESIKNLKATMNNQSMAEMIRDEIILALSQKDTFRSKEYALLVEDISKLKLFSGLKAPRIVNELTLERSSAALLGLFDHAEYQRSSLFNRDVSLKIFLPVTMVGAIAVFEFLRRKMGLRVEVQFTCCNGPDVMRELKSERADMAVLPSGSAGDLCHNPSHLRYRPLMIVPGGTYAILSNKTNTQPRPEAFLMITDRPSSAVTYLDQAEAFNLVESGIPRVHAEVDESIATLMNDSEGLLSAHWFPAHNLGEVSGLKRVLLSTPVSPVRHTLANFLFVRADLLCQPGEADLMTRLVRHAWLQLGQDASLVEMIVDDLCERDGGHFPIALRRCSGILS